MTETDSTRTPRSIFWVLLSVAVLILLASIFVEPLAARRGVLIPIAAMLLILGIAIQGSGTKPDKTS